MARITRQDAEKFLASVPDQYAFWLHGGQVLGSMRELGDALNTMSDETFAYHSNDLKKDFGNWVRDVIGDERLARDIDKSPSRVEAARIVAKRVSFLESRLT